MHLYVLILIKQLYGSPGLPLALHQWMLSHSCTRNDALAAAESPEASQVTVTPLARGYGLAVPAGITSVQPPPDLVLSAGPR